MAPTCSQLAHPPPPSSPHVFVHTVHTIHLIQVLEYGYSLHVLQCADKGEHKLFATNKGDGSSSGHIGPLLYHPTWGGGQGHNDEGHSDPFKKARKMFVESNWVQCDFVLSRVPPRKPPATGVH
jgi:hypothetical protein